MLSLILALLLGAYAATTIWLVPAGALPESSWCRAWMCATDAETQHEYQAYLQATNQQSPGTLTGFAEILRRDPASAFRWCDLAEAMLESNRVDGARYAIHRAVELGPYSAPVLLRAANFYFRVNDLPQALEFSRALLGQVSDYDAILFSDYDRFEIPVDAVLAKGIPADRRAAQSYFSHVLTASRVTDAGRIWNWITAHNFADDALAGSYVAFLLRQNAAETAMGAWVDYLGNRRGDYPKVNLLFNGDFENAPTGSLLDWQIDAPENVQVTRDSSITHSGRFAIHLQFDGTANVALNHVTQTAIVKPGEYALEYFIKTDGITTNEGVRLRVADAGNPELLNIVTEPASGTSDWRRVETKFVVVPRTHLLRVQIVRLPSQKFDNKIVGSAWVDSVRLLRAGL